MHEQNKSSSKPRVTYVNQKRVPPIPLQQQLNPNNLPYENGREKENGFKEQQEDSDFAGEVESNSMKEICDSQTSASKANGWDTRRSLSQIKMEEQRDDAAEYSPDFEDEDKPPKNEERGESTNAVETSDGHPRGPRDKKHKAGTKKVAWQENFSGESINAIDTSDGLSQGQGNKEHKAGTKNMVSEENFRGESTNADETSDGHPLRPRYKKRKAGTKNVASQENFRGESTNADETSDGHPLRPRYKKRKAGTKNVASQENFRGESTNADETSDGHPLRPRYKKRKAGTKNVASQENFRGESTNADETSDGHPLRPRYKKRKAGTKNVASQENFSGESTNAIDTSVGLSQGPGNKEHKGTTNMVSEENFSTTAEQPQDTSEKLEDEKYYKAQLGKPSEGSCNRFFDKMVYFFRLLLHPVIFLLVFGGIVLSKIGFQAMIAQLGREEKKIIETISEPTVTRDLLIYLLAICLSIPDVFKMLVCSWKILFRICERRGTTDKAKIPYYKKGTSNTEEETQDERSYGKVEMEGKKKCCAYYFSCKFIPIILVEISQCICLYGLTFRVFPYLMPIEVCGVLISITFFLSVVQFFLCLKETKANTITPSTDNLDQKSESEGQDSQTTQTSNSNTFKGEKKNGKCCIVETCERFYCPDCDCNVSPCNCCSRINGIKVCVANICDRICNCFRDIKFKAVRHILAFHFQNVAIFSLGAIVISCLHLDETVNSTEVTVWIVISVIFIWPRWIEIYLPDNCNLYRSRKGNIISEKQESVVTFIIMLFRIAVAVGFITCCFCYTLRNPKITLEIFLFSNVNYSSLNQSFSYQNNELGSFQTVFSTDTEIVVSEKWRFAVMFPFILHIGMSILCYYLAMLACRICMQKVCFALPLNTATPIYFLIVYLDSKGLVCQSGKLFGFIEQNKLVDELVAVIFALCICSWVTQNWILGHIWKKQNERVPYTNRLFQLPNYCSPLIDVSLIHSRKRERILVPKRGMNSSSKVYICATMWHEEKKEMETFLKSIFRMDWETALDEFCSRTEDSNEDTENLIDFEAHIIFDDAFDCTQGKENDKNRHVQRLFTSIKTAKREYYAHVNKLVKCKKVSEFDTPYGSQVIWMLPGKKQLVLHLKDKDKIRKGKRWSQVMYFKYLLEHKTDIEKLNKEQLHNTFILALDGDVNFQHDSVKRLCERMKRDSRIGATCGRIKPCGTGPVVWYQRFEYAIGHWLQKSTEHVLGCVLCSPGCFSLFRASSVLHGKTLEAYGSKSKKPRHFIQHDQGEDRWFCTLLLKEGFRVEYCASAEALTFAPETHTEFFKQRRRWSPSTVANIVDLLFNSRQARRNNPDISIFYVIYQFFLLISALLGPATILLAIESCFRIVFNLPSWVLYLMIYSPVITFVVICYHFKSRDNIQLTAAFILSGVYGLAMLTVILGTVIAISNTWLVPSSILVYAIAGIFVLALIVHPTDVKDFLYIPLYLVAIPEGYIFIIIYAVCNLDNISWGTREDLEAAAVKNKDVETKKENNESRNRSKTEEQITDIDRVFWDNLIKHHLKPIVHNPPEMDELKNQLIGFRNKALSIFLFINGVWIIIFSCMNEVQEYFSVKVYIFGNAITIQPFGFAFIFVFVILLLLQTVGMLVHRYDTLLHVLACKDLRHSSLYYSKKIRKYLIDILLRKFDSKKSTTDGKKKGDKQINTEQLDRNQETKNAEEDDENENPTNEYGVEEKEREKKNPTKEELDNIFATLANRRIKIEKRSYLPELFDSITK